MSALNSLDAARARFGAIIPELGTARLDDPTSLISAAVAMEIRVPPLEAGPWTKHDRDLNTAARALRQLAAGVSR
ncbi:hypothetical protein ACWGCW_00690 [Streptomyces sp. NPDC054933]